MPPELVSRQAIQPWMVIVSVLLASGWGLWCQLGVIAGGAGQQSATAAADSLSRAWHEGCVQRVGRQPVWRGDMAMAPVLLVMGGTGGEG